VSDRDAVTAAFIAIAAEHATFFDPHTTYGMAACFEPMFMFGQLPWGELCRMSLLGNYERISAQKAEQLGLVSEVRVDGGGRREILKTTPLFRASWTRIACTVSRGGAQPRAIARRMSEK